MGLLDWLFDGGASQSVEDAAAATAREIAHKRWLAETAWERDPAIPEGYVVLSVGDDCAPGDLKWRRASEWGGGVNKWYHLDQSDINDGYGMDFKVVEEGDIIVRHRDEIARLAAHVRQRSPATRLRCPHCGR